MFSTSSTLFLFSISDYCHLGVLLLNAVLTVVAHNANSHQGKVDGLLSFSINCRAYLSSQQ